MFENDAAVSGSAELVVGGPLPELSAALAAVTLSELGRRPGFFLTRPSRDLGETARLPGPGAPYLRPWPTAEDRPQELRHPPRAALLHAPVEAAQAALVLDALPRDATVVVDAGAPELVAQVAERGVRAVPFGLEGDPPGALGPPVWMGAPYGFQGGVQPLELFVGGTSCGRVFSALPTGPLVRLVVGTIAFVAEAFPGVTARDAARSLRGFRGLAGVLEEVGQAAGVTVVLHRVDDPGARRLGVDAARARRPTAGVIVLTEESSGFQEADQLVLRWPGAGAEELAAAVRDVAVPGDVVLVATEPPDQVDALLVALARSGLSDGRDPLSG